jgi:SAM-dependent methyltransferase
MNSSHRLAPPSLWVRRFSPLIKPAGRVLDVACGSGRHLRWLAQQGFAVTGIDRDAAALAVATDGLSAQGLCADIEGDAWPLPGATFDALVVTNYLWRPLWPQLLASMASGGVLIYETFAAGNETVGRPARPDFLLQPAELLRVCGGLRIVAFEEGFLQAPDRFVQRIAAVVQDASVSTPARYALNEQGAHHG